jgi:hypothetical protein
MPFTITQDLPIYDIVSAKGKDNATSARNFWYQFFEIIFLMIGMAFFLVFVQKIILFFLSLSLIINQPQKQIQRAIYQKRFH